MTSAGFDQGPGRAIEIPGIQHRGDIGPVHLDAQARFLAGIIQRAGELLGRDKFPVLDVFDYKIYAV